MKYTIEIELPDNDTILEEIKTVDVHWSFFGYSGSSKAKPKEQTQWIPVDEAKPGYHKFVILTGIEAINNARVYDIKCWDRDTWRPCNSAPSIYWDYWHKLPEEPPRKGRTRT